MQLKNGYFVDPVSTNRISGPDKKMSSTLIFNAIYEAATIKNLLETLENDYGVSSMKANN